MSCFLAGMAAGADAAYLGLKNFLRPRRSGKLSTTELARMVDLGQSERSQDLRGLQLTLIKASDIPAAGRLIKRLQRDASTPRPHHSGHRPHRRSPSGRLRGRTLHLSTLSNISYSRDLLAVQKLGVQRVVLPRELSIDEITQALDCGF